jgi:hypothetical protein
MSVISVSTTAQTKTAAHKLGASQIAVLHTSGWRGRQTTKAPDSASLPTGFCRVATICFDTHKFTTV